jgi:hypothetical protein
MFVFKDAFPSPLSKTKFLLPFVSFTFSEPFLPFIPLHCLLPSHSPLFRDNPDFCQEKGCRLHLTVQAGKGQRWDPWTVSQGFLWADKACVGVFCQGVPGIRRRSLACVASPPSQSHQSIWSLIDSNLEETNLTSRLRMHGPKVNRRTMMTKGLSRGRNQVRDGNWDLLFLYLSYNLCTYCSFSHRVLCRITLKGVSTCPEVLI